MEMKINLWEIQDYVKQATDDYTEMANTAERSGQANLANYYDGICEGMKLLLDYLEWYENDENK